MPLRPVARIDARALVVGLSVLAGVVGIGWGLPGTDSWAADAISPRSCGLGAIVESYAPGHFHQYPPLHLLVLTVLSLPWILGAIARVGLDRGALEAALIEPRTMTPIELGARVVAIAMFAGIVLGTMRLWGRILGRDGAEDRAGSVAAGLIVALNPTLVYYAHTGNLEVPYLFWSVWALVEIDRVVAGEARERQALLAIVAAALTKDQAAGMFVLTVPALLVAFPSLVRRRGLASAIGWAALVYAVVSGALVNPVGFARRCALLFGPASADWAQYPKGWGGRLAIVRDAVRAAPRYGSWGLALAAVTGVVVVMATRRGSARIRALVPLLAAASFTVLFTFGARRTEDRFLLPQSVLLLPYGAALVSYAARGVARRIGAIALAAIAVVPALLGVASIDATLLADARYRAERALSALPEGTRIEVYGGPHFLPRLPSKLSVTRVGTDDPDARSHLSGVVELRAQPGDIEARRPAYVVLSTEFSHAPDADPDAAHAIYGVASYTDPASHRFFADLARGALPYERVVRATCDVPWPLACREIHGSTGGEVWIFRRRE